MTTNHALSKALAALALLSTLSACGGGDTTTPTMMPQPTLTAATPAAGAVGTMPVPDCAPEGCKGLRIIDGNAEAWRADAAKRNTRDAVAEPGA